MEMQFTAFIPIVFAMIETAEKMGLKKNIAHLLALPIGIVISFAAIPEKTVFEHIVYGLLIGFGAIGTCDTICNGKEMLKKNGKGKGCPHRACESSDTSEDSKKDVPKKKDTKK